MRPVLVLALCGAGARVRAQFGEEYAAGDSVETRITQRSNAVRLRAEIQSTEDDDALVERDIAYARFPTETYSGELMTFYGRNTSAGAMYSWWDNAQDGHVDHWRVSVRVPVDDVWTVTWSERHYLPDVGTKSASYYLGLSRLLGPRVYTYTQYRFSWFGEDDHAHQVSQYVSYHPRRGTRVAGQLGVSDDSLAGNGHPWYGQLMASVFLRPDWTSTRLEALYYDTGAGTSYEQYNAYLYQRIGGRSFLRLGYRYYTDTEGYSSAAWGIKGKHFFSARISGHAGYRWYDHSEGPNLTTLYLGLGVVL